MAKTNKKGMRIKDVGATINLGNYSSLHITIGEESEFAGLDLAKSETYLRNIAKSVGGVLNLPDHEGDKREQEPKGPTTEVSEVKESDKTRDFAGNIMYYDNATHSYVDESRIKYDSVTTMIGTFYPFVASGVIAQEYMDFASNFGNLIHTSIQNAIIGKPPKKKLITPIIKDVLDAVGEYNRAWVEQIIMDPEHEIAGRFDILTRKDEETTLWDVKTNSDLFSKIDCTLPEQLKEKFGNFWNVQTTYGEHCLQLNTYAYILETYYNQKIDKIKIIHVPDSFKEVIEIPKVDITQLFDAYARTR